MADVEGLSAVAEGSGGVEGGGEGGATGPSYVCIPDEERMELEGDFLELMQVCCAPRSNSLSSVFAFVSGLHGPGHYTLSCQAAVCQIASIVTDSVSKPRAILLIQYYLDFSSDTVYCR